MNPDRAAPLESGLACASCGWVEVPGAAECRSCGNAMPGAGMAYAPALPELVPSTGATGATSAAGAASPTPLPRPRFTISPPRSVLWEGLASLLFRRRTFGLILLLVVVQQFSSSRPISHPPGILIKEEPLQGPVPAGQGFWKSGDNNIRALASYTIKARVLHLERYRWDDMADLAPVDLGVGWGVMSDETYAARCSFSNSGRYLNWWWSGDDFPTAAATPCMTNMHMLPATGRVRDRLLSLRPGQLFQAAGYLVEVTRPGMGPWTSSLSRHDTGNGACEIMWVQSLMPLP